MLRFLAPFIGSAYFSCEFWGAQNLTKGNITPAFRNESFHWLIRWFSTSTWAGQPQPCLSNRRNMSLKQSTTRSTVLLRL